MNVHLMFRQIPREPRTVPTLFTNVLLVARVELQMRMKQRFHVINFVTMRTRPPFQPGELLAVFLKHVSEEEVPAFDYFPAVWANAFEVLSNVVADVVGLV